MKTGCWKLPTWLWKLYRIMKSWIRERKFEPGAKRKWETILGIYRWRETGIIEDFKSSVSWMMKLYKACLMFQLQQSYYLFLELFTLTESNLSSGYQFHVELFTSMLVSHMSYLRDFLKLWWCLGQPRLRQNLCSWGLGFGIIVKASPLILMWM